MSEGDLNSSGQVPKKKVDPNWALRFGVQSGKVASFKLGRGRGTTGGQTSTDQSESSTQSPPLTSPSKQDQPEQKWQSSKPTEDRGATNMFSAGRAKSEFERLLKESMPEIHKAKQFVLTVDGEFRQAEKDDSESQLTTELGELSRSLQEQQKALTQFSSVVRAKSEEGDFVSALDAFKKGLEVARGISGSEEGFAKTLSKYNQLGPEHLAGDYNRVPGETELERAWEQAEPELLSALDIKSECLAVQAEQQRLREAYGDGLAAKRRQDIDGANQALDVAKVRAASVLKLVDGWGAFQAELAKHEGTLTLARRFDPQGVKEKETAQAECLKTLAEAEQLAKEAGDFAKAQERLAQAVEQAGHLWQGGSEAALAYQLDRKEIMPQVEKALSINVPCQAIQQDQDTLRSYCQEIDSAAKEGDFQSTDMLLGMANARQMWIQQQTQAWNALQAKLEQQQKFLEAAAQVKLSGEQATLGQELAQARKLLETQAQAGDFPAAEKALGAAVLAAEKIFQGTGKSQAPSFYKQLAEDDKTLEAAKSVKPGCAAVRATQESFLEARRELDQDVQDGDFEHAEYQLSLTVTRASETLRLQAEFEAYQRDSGVYEKQLQAALQDSDIPGVSELQAEVRELQATALKTLESDPVAARNVLQQAVRVAVKVAELRDVRQKQQQRSDALREVFGGMEQSYLPPGGADNLENQGQLGGDDVFDRFLSALRDFEQNKGDPNARAFDLTALQDSAKDYLQAFGQLSQEAQGEPKAARRKQVCETTLKQVKHLELLETYKELGDPPWNQQQEDRAADIYTKVLFESGDLPMESSPTTFTGAKWIKSMDWEKGKGKREFIFKQAGTDSLPGFPKGGETSREVLADTLGRTLKAATGLDFAMPETRIIGIDPTKLGKGAGAGETLGSAQASAPCVGTVNEILKTDPELIAKIPASAVQKMAIFDMVALNMDRHGGNFLVSPPSETDGAPGLVPIDNGVAFPTRKGFENRRLRLFKDGALGDLPAATEKFTDESLAAIDNINADEIIAAMQQRLDGLDREHPQLGLKNSGPQDESFHILKRSVAFMKAAARELSPHALQEALMLNSAGIFDTPDEELGDKFAAIIRDTQERRDAYAAFGPPEQRMKAYMRLFDLGWNLYENWGPKSKERWWEAWTRKNAKLATRILAKDLPSPAATREVEAGLKEILKVNPQSDIKTKLEGKTLREQYELVTETLNGSGNSNPGLRKKAADDETLQELKRLFPKAKIPQLEKAKSQEERKSQEKELASHITAFRDFKEWGFTQVQDINGVSLKKLSWPGAYRAAEALGKQKDTEFCQELLNSNEWKQMLAEYEQVLEKAALSDNATFAEWPATKLKKYWALWQTFQQRGGFGAYFEALGDDGAIHMSPDGLADMISLLDDANRNEEVVL